MIELSLQTLSCHARINKAKRPQHEGVFICREQKTPVESRQNLPRETKNNPGRLASDQFPGFSKQQEMLLT
jgi:hypothetical protein